MTDLEELLNRIDSFTHKTPENLATRVGIREQVQNNVDEGFSYPHTVYYLERTVTDTDNPQLKQMNAEIKGFSYGSDHMQSEVALDEVDNYFKMKIESCVDGARLMVYPNPCINMSDPKFAAYLPLVAKAEGTKEEMVELLESRKAELIKNKDVFHTPMMDLVLS